MTSSSVASHSAISTSSTSAPTHSPAALDDLSAYIGPCSGSCPTPNVVHVVIHTTLTIPDYARYYDSPVSSFHPSYVALRDGSLISSVYTQNLRLSEAWLVMGGALSVFFFRNTLTAIRYSRIVRVKNRSLFYMLIASQAVGFLVSVTFVIADFNADFDCTAVGMFKKIGLLISSTLMVTGILGTKAYRCLRNAGFVIVVLATLRAAIVAISAIAIVEYKGGRRFTGTCQTMSESPLLPAAIVLQFIEMFFLCVCFFWAVYRAYRSPADHARLSLPLEDEDEISSVETHEKDDGMRGRATRRGWWDYVPNTDVEKSTRQTSSGLSSPKDLADRLRRWWSGEPTLPSNVFQRKPSLPGDLPLPQPRRVSSTSHAPSRRLPIAHEGERPRASSPPPPSVMERIIRYVPRANLLRNVLKNELLYTTFITAVLLVIAIIMLVGVTQQVLLGVNSWIMLDWTVISLCTMHSFGRVAHRHERDLWLQDPTNWRSMRHAEIEDETALRPKNSRRAWSPVSVASNWRHRQRQRAGSDALSFGSRYRSSDGGGGAASSVAGAGAAGAHETTTTTFGSSSRSSRSSRLRSSSCTRPTEHPAPVPISRSTSTSVVVAVAAAAAASPVAASDAGFRPPVSHAWTTTTGPRAHHAQHAHAHATGSSSPTILPSPECLSSSGGTPHSDMHAILSPSSSSSSSSLVATVAVAVASGSATAPLPPPAAFRSSSSPPAGAAGGTGGYPGWVRPLPKRPARTPAWERENLKPPDSLG